MDITGRLIKILPEVRGESARGPWVRGGFVIETEDTYPRQVAFTLFGEDRIAMVTNLPLNSIVVVTFSPESREYNDRWYTDLRCIRVVAASAAAPAQAAAPQQPMAAAAPAAPFASQPDDPNEDLPF